MNKDYGWILITYILMHLSGFIGGPLLAALGVPHHLILSVWTVVSFSAASLVVLVLLWRSTYRNAIERQQPVPLFRAAVWSVLGVFMAYAAQYAGIIIETLLGIPQGSENTQQVIGLVETFPIVILSVAVFGPFLEEIVFRKIIFGSLYEKMPFFAAALISSLIFSAAHWEWEHTILYAAMGFTFAYLYVKTKRIIVPIVAHVAMNSFVVLMQYVFADEIEEMIRLQQEQMPQWISWFL